MKDEPLEIDPRELELYKLAVEMADRVSARRATSNTFFLTVQTAFVSVLSIATPKLHESEWWNSLAVSIVGLALSGTWWMQLRSYRDLNKAKFSVINKMEARLPVSIFADEWTSLKKDPIPAWRGRYAELGTIERTVPVLFAALYVLLFVARLT